MVKKAGIVPTIVLGLIAVFGSVSESAAALTPAQAMTELENCARDYANMPVKKNTDTAQYKKIKAKVLKCLNAFELPQDTVAARKVVIDQAIQNANLNENDAIMFSIFTSMNELDRSSKRLKAAEKKLRSGMLEKGFGDVAAAFKVALMKISRQPKDQYNTIKTLEEGGAVLANMREQSKGSSQTAIYPQQRK